MSDAVWFHLIDVCGDTVKFLLGPVIVAVVSGVTIWWRSRVTADKVDEAAKVLAVTTHEQVQTVLAKTDEQTKVLTKQTEQQNVALQEIKEVIKIDKQA